MEGPLADYQLQIDDDIRASLSLFSILNKEFGSSNTTLEIPPQYEDACSIKSVRLYSVEGNNDQAIQSQIAQPTNFDIAKWNQPLSSPSEASEASSLGHSRNSSYSQISSTLSSSAHSSKRTSQQLEEVAENDSQDDNTDITQQHDNISIDTQQSVPTLSPYSSPPTFQGTSEPETSDSLSASVNSLKTISQDTTSDIQLNQISRNESPHLAMYSSNLPQVPIYMSQPERERHMPLHTLQTPLQNPHMHSQMVQIRIDPPQVNQIEINPPQHHMVSNTLLTNSLQMHTLRMPPPQRPPQPGIETIEEMYFRTHEPQDVNYGDSISPQHISAAYHFPAVHQSTQPLAFNNHNRQLSQSNRYSSSNIESSLFYHKDQPLPEPPQPEPPQHYVENFNESNGELQYFDKISGGNNNFHEHEVKEHEQYELPKQQNNQRPAEYIDYAEHIEHADVKPIIQHEEEQPWSYGQYVESPIQAQVFETEYEKQQEQLMKEMEEDEEEEEEPLTPIPPAHMVPIDEMEQIQNQKQQQHEDPKEQKQQQQRPKQEKQGKMKQQSPANQLESKPSTDTLTQKHGGFPKRLSFMRGALRQLNLKDRFSSPEDGGSKFTTAFSPITNSKKAKRRDIFSGKHRVSASDGELMLTPAKSRVHWNENNMHQIIQSPPRSKSLNGLNQLADASIKEEDESENAPPSGHNNIEQSYNENFNDEEGEALDEPVDVNNASKSSSVKPKTVFISRQPRSSKDPSLLSPRAAVSLQNLEKCIPPQIPSPQRSPVSPRSQTSQKSVKSPISQRSSTEQNRHIIQPSSHQGQGSDMSGSSNSRAPISNMPYFATLDPRAKMPATEYDEKETAHWLEEWSAALARDIERFRDIKKVHDRIIKEEAFRRELLE